MGTQINRRRRNHLHGTARSSPLLEEEIDETEAGAHDEVATTATPTTRGLTTATSAATASQLPETIPRAWGAAVNEHGLQVAPVPRTPAATGTGSGPEILRDPATPDLRAANVYNFGAP